MMKTLLYKTIPLKYIIICDEKCIARFEYATDRDSTLTKFLKEYPKTDFAVINED